MTDDLIEPVNDPIPEDEGEGIPPDDHSVDTDEEEA